MPSTQLSRQLSAIRSDPARTTGTVSFLFDQKTAALLDANSVYEVALPGFHELTRVEPGFFPFLKSLFSAQLKFIDRLSKVFLLVKLASFDHFFPDSRRKPKVRLQH